MQRIKVSLNYKEKLPLRPQVLYNVCVVHIKSSGCFVLESQSSMKHKFKTTGKRGLCD